MKKPCGRRRISKTAPGTGGFTLLELLVAISVFAVIAGAAYAGLDSATSTEMKLDEAGRKWKNMAFFMGHLERDLACFVDRPVTGPDGAKLRSMTVRMSGGSGMDVEFEFTRLGRGAEGSAPKRVAYRLNGDKIEALVWPALDLAPTAKPEVYEGMDGVESFDVKLSSGDGNWSQEWNNDSPPKAVDVTVTLKSGEKIWRLIVLR
jgi:general secretion pathway protein J